MNWPKLGISVLQNISNEFFSKLGNNLSIVPVEITTNPQIIAGAQGIKLFNVPLGKIYLNSSLPAKLSNEELNFVLAHEAVHIDQNHLPAKLPKEILDEIGKIDPIAKGLSTLWDIGRWWAYQQGDLPLDVKITKDQELKADIWAIFLTGNNKTAAINCLKKLVGNNLNAPSHTWEAFKALGLDVKFPVMTMQERINCIQSMLSYFEEQGHKFI